MSENKDKLLREPETKTIYVNKRHLQPRIREKLLKGHIKPFNILWVSLTAETRSRIYNYTAAGYKTVFVHDKKNVLLIYNK